MIQNSELILIDTRLFLEDPDIVARIRRRNGMPFLATDATGHALSPATACAESLRLLNPLAQRTFQRMSSLPGGASLQPNDHLRRVDFQGGALFLLGRESLEGNERLLALAQDYGLLLLSRDAALTGRAEANGVQAVLWSGPLPNTVPTTPTPSVPSVSTPPTSVIAPTPFLAPTAPSVVQPFATPKTPRAFADFPLPVRHLPESGQRVHTPEGKHFILGELISAGGEGKIFATPNPQEVCKIYYRERLTDWRRRKLELMLSRPIKRAGLSWPLSLVLNNAGEFVGYLMPRASGRTVQASMFVKPLLEKNFPHWQRKDLVNLCSAFIEQVAFLHSLNILIGDINPLNLLINGNSQELWLVDTDSFQIEDFPCPVGTVNFTPPELQGTNYRDYLRSKDHELFAVATMLFMFLHPGKPPYSQQGGGSPADNIRAMDFPYMFARDAQRFSGQKAPQGPWQRIWSNLPWPIREAFHNTFRLNQRTTLEEWRKLLRRYQYSLDRGLTHNALFPASFRLRDPAETTCADCGVRYMESRQLLRRFQRMGRIGRCPTCAHKAMLQNMADQSQQTHQDVGKNLPLLRKTSTTPSNSTLSSSAVSPSSGGNGAPVRGLIGFF